jgi:hypothetical protein
MRHRLLAGLFFSTASLAFGSLPLMSQDQRPVLTVRAHVLTPFLDFFRYNGLARDEERYRDLAKDPVDSEADPAYLVARADDGFVDDPGGIVVLYDHPHCPLTLPAGRQVKYAPEAGLVREIEAIFPLEPMTWNDMQAMVTAQVAALDGAGWKRSTGYFSPNQPVKPVLEPADFLEATGPKWAQVGYWEQCDTPMIKAYLEVRHYNSSSPGSFTPPAVLADPLDPLAEDRFLLLMRIEVEFDSPLRQDLEDLAQRRRLEVNGDAFARLGAEVWLDDPGWRPEGWVGQVMK